jgi:hypothetical protein
MRHLRPYLALLSIAAITAACSSPPGSGAGGESSQESQPSQGSQPSQAAVSSAGGGGGGGGGANGSITYEITGEYEASGELPFLAGGVSLWVESAGGWVANFANQSGEGAVILLNTQAQSTGQIFTYGDGTSILAATSDPGSGFDCTFTLTKNDESGLKGDLDCSTALVIDNNSGAQKKVHVTAHWDAHP